MEENKVLRNSIARIYQLILVETRTWFLDKCKEPGRWPGPENDERRKVVCQASKWLANQSTPFRDYESLIYIMNVAWGEPRNESGVDGFWDHTNHRNRPLSYPIFVKDILNASIYAKKSLPQRLIPNSQVPPLLKWVFQLLKQRVGDEHGAFTALVDMLVDCIQHTGLNMWPSPTTQDGRRTLCPQRWIFLDIPDDYLKQRSLRAARPLNAADRLAHQQEAYAANSPKSPWSLLDTPLSNIQKIYTKTTFPDEWKYTNMVGSKVAKDSPVVHSSQWALDNLIYDDMVVKDAFIIVRLLAEIAETRKVGLVPPDSTTHDGHHGFQDHRIELHTDAANSFLRSAPFRLKGATDHQGLNAKWVCQRIVVLLCYTCKDSPFLLSQKPGSKDKCYKEYSKHTSRVGMNRWTLIKLGIMEYVMRNEKFDPWAPILSRQNFKLSATLADSRVKRQTVALEKPSNWVSKLFQTLVPMVDIQGIPSSTLNPTGSSSIGWKCSSSVMGGTQSCSSPHLQYADQDYDYMDVDNE